MEFNQTPQSRFRGFLKEQGFYVILVISLVVIGAAVALLTLPGDNMTAEQPVENAAPVAETNDETLTDILTLPSVPPAAIVLPTPTPAPAVTPAPTPVPTPTPKAKAASAPAKASPPVTGEIVWGYAVDKLIYSKTLDQWMTHEGVDIAAAVGTQVTAVMAGTVEKVYEDDALGMTVVVAHSNDRATLYANLAEDIPVQAGDKVNAGTVLGAVGQTSLSECAEAPHLHFGFYIGNKPVNPAEHVRIG